MKFVRNAALVSATLCAITGLGVGAPAMAQSMQGGPTAQAPAESQRLMQQLLEKRQQIQELNAELIEIQQQTLKDHPDLAEEREAFAGRVEEELVAAGQDPEGTRAELGRMREDLEGGELGPQERRQLAQTYRTQVNQLRQAESQIIRDSDELSAMRQQITMKLQEAMQEDYPRTQELVSQLRDAQREFQQLSSQLQGR
jgi:hypothetical protein